MNRSRAVLPGGHASTFVGEVAPPLRPGSYPLREELDGIVRELSTTRTISDPAGAQRLETRKAVVTG